MEEFNNLIDKYKKLKQEYENYQSLSESTIQAISERNISLEKRLDSLTNIVEVSKYINSYVSDENLIPMINDMIIGILGVTYSTIYLKEKNDLIVKATNIKDIDIDYYKKRYYKKFNSESAFLVNNKKIISPPVSGGVEIHSLAGVPIMLREKFLGYIVVEHTLCNFFNREHVKFISSIANQVGIALENNFLYNQIREASIRDPLLGIYNRKYFFELIEKLISQDASIKFATVMLDFDNFKKTNDLCGHQFGDEVLVNTINLIKSCIGKKDIIARYGGEEIVISISSVSGYENVFKLIDDIRFKISKNVIQFKGIEKSITVSFGISYYPEDGNTFEEVISVADEMMYVSKRMGRNMVTSSH